MDTTAGDLDDTQVLAGKPDNQPVVDHGNHGTADRASAALGVSDRHSWCQRAAKRYRIRVAPLE